MGLWVEEDINDLAEIKKSQEGNQKQDCPAETKGMDHEGWREMSDLAEGEMAQEPFEMPGQPRGT